MPQVLQLLRRGGRREGPAGALPAVHSLGAQTADGRWGGGLAAISGASNPFAGPDPPSAAHIRDLNIFDRVPVRLDQSTSTYYAWKTYFSLVFSEYYLHDHIDCSGDASLMKGEAEWMVINPTLIRWSYITISKGPLPDGGTRR